jgi:hypothetical protein
MCYWWIKFIRDSGFRPEYQRGLLNFLFCNFYFAIFTLHFAFCILHFAFCILHFAFCILQYALHV